MRKTAALLLSVLIIISMSTECFSVPKGAVLIDSENGRVLFELEKDRKLPMASTTKIMTALIALEEDVIDEYFSVSENAVAVEGSSMGLVPGDKVTLRILAEGMLLASGNDAANAAAIKISGSLDEFVRLMNERAKEMGLKSTSFETPSGLDGENHYSTAYEMALIAKNALKNPLFAEICSKETIKAEFGNPPYNRSIINHNRLLQTFEGTTGVKTGFTKKAGRCLVSSAEREGVSLICATLDCSDDWNYHSSLYEKFFGELKCCSLEKIVEEIEVTVCGGISKTVKAVPKKVSAALFKGESEKIEVIISKPPFVFAPIEEGDILGNAIFYLGGEVIAKTPLVAENKIENLPENKGFWNGIKEIF